MKTTKVQDPYDTDQVLQLAIMVDRKQGFIKSGYGYVNHSAEPDDPERMIFDNKTAIMNYLNSENIPEIHDDIIDEANNIKDTFRNNLITKKLMGNLSGFDTAVMETISEEKTSNYGVAILASIPNSFRITTKRDILDQWFDDMRSKSEFVGIVGERYQMQIEIKDVKYISKIGIHLVTGVNQEDNIIKFFFNKEPDVSGIIEGKSFVMTGKVKSHDVSKFSQCNETVFHYVKIQESA